MEEEKKVLAHTPDELVRGLDGRFIGRHQESRALAASMIGAYNTLLIGPPGTGKTAMVDTLVSAFDGMNNFYVCLAADVTPEAIWGPMDVAALLNSGEWRIKTAGHAAEADTITLDETFRGNTVVHDSTLDPMMNKRFKANGNLIPIPVISFFGASNFLPAPGSGYDAFLDRWHLRIYTEYMTDAEMELALTRKFSGDASLGNKFTAPMFTRSDLTAWQDGAKAVGFTRDVQVCLPEVLKAIKAVGLPLSDRTAMRCQDWMKPFAYIDGASKVKRVHLKEVLLLTTWTDEAQLKTLRDTIEATLASIPEEAEDIDLLVQEAITDLQNAPDKTAVANIMARSKFIGKDERTRTAANDRNAILDRELIEATAIVSMDGVKTLEELKMLQKNPNMKKLIETNPDVEDAYKRASVRCIQNLMDRG